LKIVYFADLVGKPGRTMFKYHMKKIREQIVPDLVIVNGENASHGFGLTQKNAKELFHAGVDLFTGGNHSWDKRDGLPLLEEGRVLRPINYPSAAPGKGIKILDVGDEKLVVINLMGYYTMPMVDNPFTMITKEVERLRDEGYNNIFIDFHAEATAEKRTLMAMLRGKVSAICGSHTHVGTDDLVIDEGTFYVTDVGLTGCRDNVIGIANKEPIERSMLGYSGKFDVPNQCKKILQAVVFEIEEGRCKEAFKIKAYDEREFEVVQYAYKEE
jgi:metallophosphoesterase (TIGR00282 family)